MASRKAHAKAGAHQWLQHWGTHCLIALLFSALEGAAGSLERFGSSSILRAAITLGGEVTTTWAKKTLWGLQAACTCAGSVRAEQRGKQEGNALFLPNKSTCVY